MRSRAIGCWTSAVAFWRIKTRSTSEPFFWRSCEELGLRRWVMRRRLNQGYWAIAGAIKWSADWNEALVAHLSRRMAPQPLLLEYYLVAPDLYIFQRTHDSLEVHRVAGAVPRLERLLALWRINLELAARASAAQDYGPGFAHL